VRKDEQGIVVWAVGGMEKVFADAVPDADAPGGIELAGAAGECEVAQIAVRAEAEDVVLTRPEIGALTSEHGEIGAESVSGRFVELVPVRFASQGIPKEELARVAPGYFPDPLCLEDRMIVPGGQTRAIWLCFNIPQDARAGTYQGEVKVTSSAGERVVKVKLTVWAFALPRDIPFAMTEWFWPGITAKYHCVEVYSEAFWELMEMYAADMEAHRQNTILTHIVGADGIVGITRTRGGEYRFDFTKFDRWVEIFLAHRFRFIEGSHIFDGSVRFVRVTDEASGEEGIVEKLSDKDHIIKDEEYMAILAALLAALRDHVREKGWSDHYIQHIFDEPSPGQVENYLWLVAFVRGIWPEVPLVDATGCETRLFDAVDILVPLMGTKRAYEDMETYRERGKTFWTYTCNWPRDSFPNRYIDQPLILTRIIPWVFWRYGVTGYLHWAYARWSPHHTHDRVDYDPYTGQSDEAIQLVNPWADTVLGATWSCPAGDAWMVYPPRDPLSKDPDILVPDLPDVMERYLDGHPPEDEGEDGPSLEERHPRLAGVVDSIRWEQVREGIEDYGLLWLLSEAIRKAEESAEQAAAARDAKEKLEGIVERIAPDWTHYTRDPSAIEAARGRIAEEIVRLRALNGHNERGD